MHRIRRIRGFRPLGVLLLVTAFAACDDDNGPIGPVDPDNGVLTVDASTDWAFVRLGETASEVSVSDPATSQAWDLAFFATGVMLNGGAAGPGDVEGYCLCQNADATPDEIARMTADTELAAFEAVTISSVPTDERAWQNDALVPAIEGWWSYDFTTHTVTPVTDNSWVVRTAEGEKHAKLRVAGMQNASQSNAGQVTFEFAIQEAAGEPYGATQSVTVDVTNGPAYLDLLTASISDENDWDLRVEGYEIRLNSGVSGTGEAGAVNAGTPFDVTPIFDPVEMPPRIFVSDQFGGVFDDNPWYHYDFATHQIWANFNVYLIRKGDEIYKVQLLSYNHPTDGRDRHISFRYARLAD